MDNLIELLTEKHSRCAFFDTEFPVFDNAEDFGRRTSGNQPAPRSGLYKIRGVHPAAAQRIEDLQPYNASKRLADSILWTLHRLDNIDKHRAPAVVGLVGAVMGMQFRPRPTREVREVRTAIGHLPFDEGTEFARFDPPLGGEPSMHVDAKFSLDITFDGGPVDRREVVPTLRDVLDETAAILIEFAPFLA